VSKHKEPNLVFVLQAMSRRTGTISAFSYDRSGVEISNAAMPDIRTSPLHLRQIVGSMRPLPVSDWLLRLGSMVFLTGTNYGSQLRVIIETGCSAHELLLAIIRRKIRANHVGTLYCRLRVFWRLDTFCVLLCCLRQSFSGWPSQLSFCEITSTCP
jgi:hypothetical protein